MLLQEASQAKDFARRFGGLVQAWYRIESSEMVVSTYHGQPLEGR
jgi:hypothetical protein